MPVAREREASPAAEERNNKKQKVDSLGLPAGPAIHLPDPAGLADQYKENRPYRHLSVGGLFDDAVVSGGCSARLNRQTLILSQMNHELAGRTGD